MERNELADGMKDVGMESSLWGFSFTWDNLPIMGSNIVVIEDDITEAVQKDIIEWYNKKDYRRIAFTDQDLVFDQIQLDNDLLFMRRETQKQRAPFLPNYTIRHFSFENRDLKMDSRKLTSGMSHMIGKTVEETREIERYIGGFLHMLNGKIWVLENIDENIFAAALFGSFDSDVYSYLELASKNTNMVDDELYQNFLKFTFESYSETPIYSHCKDKSTNLELYQNLGFKIDSRLKISI